MSVIPMYVFTYEKQHKINSVGFEKIIISENKVKKE
jgi:hypothetical protein